MCVSITQSVALSFGTERAVASANLYSAQEQFCNLGVGACFGCSCAEPDPMHLVDTFSCHCKCVCFTLPNSQSRLAQRRAECILLGEESVAIDQTDSSLSASYTGTTLVHIMESHFTM